LCALRWLHRDEPPDLDLRLRARFGDLVRLCSTMLLGALNRHDPHLFDALPLPTG
jgi:hypothetical protein